MNLCSVADLTDADILSILEQADIYAQDLKAHRAVLQGQVIAMAFFEPSTRTRLSFEAAAHRLGAEVIGFSDAAATSTSKGETLEDTVRVLGGYGDAIVLRHPERGAATRAAGVADVPIINAGDGDGEHPTQTLLDLYTIMKSSGSIEGLKVAVVGDLKYSRTVHSLVPVLRRLKAHVTAVPAPGLELPDDMGVADLAALEEAAADADVLYVTRVQKERFLDAATYDAVQGSFLVDRDLLERTGSKATVLHPLPRVGEVARDVDELPAAKYFDQAKNGVPVRMAVLSRLLENTP